MVLVKWGTGRYTLTVLLVLYRSLSFLGAVVCQVSMLSTGETGADAAGLLSHTVLLRLWLLLGGGALLLLLLMNRTLLLLSSKTVHWGLWIRAVARASIGWAPLANHPSLAVFF